MPKSKSFKFEKNIYVDERCGSFRFAVKVKGLSDGATFSSLNEGAPWARRRRVELFEQAASGKAQGAAVSKSVRAVTPPAAHPENISLRTIFDSYVQYDVPKLAGKAAEESRTRNLQAWFGDFRLGEISNQKIEEWLTKRQNGLYGSGRNPDRGEQGSQFLSKEKRYLLSKSGQRKSTEKVYSPSTQTLRHELAVFRRAVTAFFKRTRELKNYRNWLVGHDLFTMELPSAANARRRRLTDEEVVAIFSHLPGSLMKTAVSIALTTSLRRSEVVSLRWEDVDLKRSVVLLRSPGHKHRKSKVTSREVPLLPVAIKVLSTFGMKKKGLIFPIAAGSLSQAWRRAADEAKIYDARLHDCRREAISRLVERGDLLLSHVVLFSGHSDISVLQKHYLMPNPSLVAQQLALKPQIKDFLPLQ